MFLRGGCLMARFCVFFIFLSFLGMGNKAYGLAEFYLFNGEKEIIYTKEALLKRKDKVVLDIPLLNYPNQKLKVEAVPMGALLMEAGIKDGQIVLFKALDGFSGVLAKDLLLSKSAQSAQAFLAIEGEEKWPPLEKGGASSEEPRSAGPFYLVWVNPKLSQIPPEFWPYQLAGMRFESDFRTLFPKVIPKSKSKSVVKGFEVYKARCLSCHTMNRQGPSKMGPDLNVPMSPVEYFKKQALVKFLKDPASVREWDSMKMRFVGDTGLNENEAYNVIAYLTHMAAKREKK